MNNTLKISGEQRLYIFNWLDDSLFKHIEHTKRDAASMTEVEHLNFLKTLTALNIMNGETLEDAIYNSHHLFASRRNTDYINSYQSHLKSV